MAYRLLVVDVDGTLVGASTLVTPAVAQAVRAAEAAGIRVALSTGRTPPSCAGYLRDLRLSGPHIFFDGSLVLDPAVEQPVVAHRVAPAAVQEVLAFARATSVTVELYTRDGYYVEAITPEVEAHAALQRCAPVVADLDALLAGGEVIKAELVPSTEAARAAVRAFASSLDGRLRFSWASAPGLPQLSFVNVVAPQASKGAALRAAAAYLGLPLAAVAAVGDSANDLPMFEVAGLAIAMGNAPETIRRAAHVVAGPVDADGLAEAITRHVLRADNHRPSDD